MSGVRASGVTSDARSTALVGSTSGAVSVDGVTSVGVVMGDVSVSGAGVSTGPVSEVGDVVSGPRSTAASPSGPGLVRTESGRSSSVGEVPV
jgi:hypothetical protein